MAATISVNSKGVAHARSLVRAGHVTDSTHWSPPSAEAENAYLEEHGISEYAKWFLGTRAGEDPKNKGHYAYPFSSNFSTVDLKGLKAAKSRAAQNGSAGVEKAADSLIGHHEKHSQGDMSGDYAAFHSVDRHGNITMALKNVDHIDWETADPKVYPNNDGSDRPWGF